MNHRGGTRKIKIFLVYLIGKNTNRLTSNIFNIKNHIKKEST